MAEVLTIDIQSTIYHGNELMKLNANIRGRDVLEYIARSRDDISRYLKRQTRKRDIDI